MILQDNICVYLHINPEIQEVFYVGLGNNIRPFEKNSRHTEWREYVKSINYKFDVVVIYNNLSLDEAKQIERQLISQIGRKDQGLGFLVNKSNGGEGDGVLYNAKKAASKIQNLENEIISKVKSCKTLDEFYIKYPNDFYLAEKLNMEKEIEKYVGFNDRILQEHQKKKRRKCT